MTAAGRTSAAARASLGEHKRKRGELLARLGLLESSSVTPEVVRAERARLAFDEGYRSFRDLGRLLAAEPAGRAEGACHRPACRPAAPRPGEHSDHGPR